MDNSHSSLNVIVSKSPVAGQLQHHPLKGFLLVAVALLLFACMDSATKYLAGHYNVPFVVAMRYLIHCSVMIIVLAPRHSVKLVKTQRTGLVLVRATSLTLASLFIGLALQRMPLAETTAISFLAPILVVLLASPILKERINLVGWIAVIAGFVGVLLIARPNSGLDLIGVLFALLAAGAISTYQLLSRVLASTEQAISLLFYTALVGAVCFGISLFWFWENKTPTHWEIFLFIAMGLSGGLGHYLFTLAFRHAPASLLSPFTYLQLLWAGLLGWIFFSNTPDLFSLIGMFIIAVSGVMIALKSRRIKN